MGERANGVRAPVMYSPRALDGNYYSFTLARACRPFVCAAENSVRRAREACSQAAQQGESVDALRRVCANAEAFFDFLQYSDNAARSGTDIFRYLLPLEDHFDISEGNLCGMPGVDRKKIQ